MKTFQSFLHEKSGGPLMDPGSRRKIGKALSKLDNYHQKIPLKTIDDILKKEGYLLVQEDGTEWDGFIIGSDGEDSFDIGKIDTLENKMYKIISNAMLRMQWHKMNSGKYEITVYLT